MEKQTQQKKKSRNPILIMAIVLLLMAGAGGYYWMQSGKYASTDNAVLDGDIHAVKSSVTAYLDRINLWITKLCKRAIPYSSLTPRP